MIDKSVTIIGAGLAGCEAALLLSKYGFEVELYDSKPIKLLPVYELDSYAELVCNNSLGAVSNESPLGVLKNELDFLNSELVRIANSCRVSDAKYFAIDKQAFSNAVTNEMQRCNVNIHHKLVTKLPESRPLIIATGPLTGNGLVQEISEQFEINEYHFADASSPIVDIRSIDLNNSLVVKLSDDLYGVMIPDSLFQNIKHELVQAEISKDTSDTYSLRYEKSHSIEQLAENNDESLKSRFTHPYFNDIVLLLRREIALKDGFILVGCMTAMKHSEQKRIFSMLPGFQNCRFIRYGRMHRNTYFNSPLFLDCFYKTRADDVYIIGQLSGIDGYLPAISSGVVAAYRIINGECAKNFPRETMIGAMAHYISNETVVDFQPMCASFSLLPNRIYDYKVLLMDFVFHL